MKSKRLERKGKKFALITEINKEDRGVLETLPRIYSQMERIEKSALFTFIVGVTVLTVQTIVPHSDVRPGLSVTELNAGTELGKIQENLGV